MVTNPVAEFDGCFDPHGDNTPTGVEFPSLLGVTTTALRPDSQGQVAMQATCGTGSAGCRGTVTATAGSTDARHGADRRQGGADRHVRLRHPVPAGAPEVTFTVT